MTKKTTTQDNRFEILNKGKKAEIYLYDEIGGGWLGGVTAKDFADELKAAGDVSAIDVFINSPGGSVFDGVAIYNTLKRHEAYVTVFIDGVAASIASLVAMAGDRIIIPPNGLMMIHDPWMITAGSADELRETAERLDRYKGIIGKTYARRTGQDIDTIYEKMAATTQFTADEALEFGLVDQVAEEEIKIAAHFDLSRYKTPPATPAAASTPRKDSRADKLFEIKTYVKRNMKKE